MVCLGPEKIACNETLMPSVIGYRRLSVLTMNDLKTETQLQTLLATAYHDYEKMLNLHAFFKVNDRATSEDLVQATFARTWIYLVKKGKIDMMKAFLYHALNCLIVDEYRKRKTVSLDAMRENGFEPCAAGSGRFLNFLDGKAAFVLIDRLPEKYKKIIQIRFVRELSLKEISIISGQSKGAVAVQIHRGIEKLKLLHEKGVNNVLVEA